MRRRQVLGAALGGFVPFNPFGAAWASDVAAVTLSGGATTLTQADIADFAKGLKGPVLLQVNEGYDSARAIWNAMFDRRPALIARCTDTADVVRAVQFARGHDLLMSVRGGGHNIAGLAVCDGGLMLDLSLMRGATVDTARRTARVAGGALLADLDEAAQAVGLVTTAGVVSHTGAGGLTLGGGIGRLQRTLGLTIDNLLGVEIVTADGRVVRANAEENADLHWGVRGGGGNFGVVTAFVYQLHPFDGKMVNFSFAYEFAKAKSILTNYFDYAASAPDAVHIGASVFSDRGGERGVSVSGCLYATPEQRETQLAKIRKIGVPGRERVEDVNYVQLQKSGDAASRFGQYHYSKAGFFGEITPAVTDSLLGFFNENPMPGGRAGLLAMGGAVGRVAPDATAFPNRKGSHNIDVGGATTDKGEAEKFVTWGRNYWKAIVEHTAGGGFYVNQMVEEGDRRIRDNFGGNYERLSALKRKYDPINLFRLNANVKPA